MAQISQKWKKKGNILLFVLPALIPLVIFWIYPILKTVWLSFTDWDYMTPEYNMIAFDNYVRLLKDTSLHRALRNTLVFALGTIIPTAVLGLGLALLLNNLGKGSTLYKLIIFSPWVTPTVAVSIVWTWIYEPDRGLANMILKAIGLTPLSWINSSKTALLAVIIMTIWKNLGYTMIFFIEALGRVPKELNEAASVDGAGKLKRFLSITLPMISPTTFLVTIMTTISALQAYDQIQILTQGGPSGSTRTLLYYYYQLAFQQFNMGQAAATVMILLLIIVTLSLIQYFISKRMVHY